MTTTDHQEQRQGAMEEQGQTRPRITIFAPPQSRQLVRPRPADWDLDLDYPLPTLSSCTSAHKLHVLEEKVKSFDEAKKKTHRLHKHLQQQFLKEQERKMALRKKTEEQFKKCVEVFDRRNGKVPGPTSRLPADEAKPSEQAGAADKKATKRRVQRAPPAGRAAAPASSAQKL